MSQEPPLQPPLGYYPAPPKSGMSTGAKIALGVIIGSCVVMGGCFACATFIFDQSTKNLNLNSAASNIPTVSTSPANVNSNSKVTVKQGIANAIVLRSKLEGQYRDVMANANPHLNFITSKTSKVKGGYAIWAIHTYFNRYSFKIGNDARVTTDWIITNLESLHEANIVQVGLKGDSGWAGSCWLKVF